MARRIAASDANIVHLHLPNPAAMFAFLTSGYRGPVVATYHSDIVRQKILAACLNPLTQRFLKRCDAIVVTSPNYLASSRSLVKHRERCHVIPFGIPLDSFLHPDFSLVTRIRRQYGERLILSVGRLVYYKGFEHLIEAMTLVEGTLLIAGEGPLRQKLEEKALRLGVAQKVVFLGGICDEELRACYHAADVFVLASTMRSEAFGIVQIEAMASGTPVVNTRLDTGVPFVSLHEETGLTVPPADPRCLAGSINAIFNSPRMRGEFGRAARRRAQEFFSVEKMVASTVGLYESVVKRSVGVRAAAAR